MTIEEKQLLGRYRKSNGTVGEKRWNVNQVFRDGDLVGTIGRFTGAKFCPRSGINPAEAADITRAITKLRQASDDYGPPGTPAATPVEIPEDPPEEEDDD